MGISSVAGCPGIVTGTLVTMAVVLANDDMVRLIVGFRYAQPNLRASSTNFPHHTVQRGHNRQVVFEKKTDYERFATGL